MIKYSYRIELAYIHRIYSHQLSLIVYSESILVLCLQALVIKYLSSIYILNIVSCHSTFVAVLFYSAIYCIYPLRKSIASTVDISSILSS